MDTKYIFVTGGVVSSLGKGIISASIGKLLQARGYKVTIQKFDPYINIDPGTLNPYEHGECYVTEDGFETDLDLGHYERFHGHPHHPPQQHHHRTHLQGRHRPRAPRRLLRQDHPSGTSHHRRNQAEDAGPPAPPGGGTPPTREGGEILTSSSPRWAAPSATSRVRRSWRPSDSCGGSWDGMRCAYT